MPVIMPPLYPILDESFFPEDPYRRAVYLENTVRELADAGVTLLQLRMKLSTHEQQQHSIAAVRAAAPPSMRLILNDHVGLVHAGNFDGVHLGQGDLPVQAARSLLGPTAVIGLSTHTPEEAAAGDGTSADYLAVGPIFATASKHDAEPAVGLDGVAEARRRTRKPLVAIGGITPANVKQVWEAGADSVAVIGAVFGGDKPPAENARDFLRLFR